MLGKSTGLDLGSHSLKLVELRQNLRSIEVGRLVAVPVAPGTTPLDALRDAVGSLGVGGERVVTALAGDRVARRPIRFPFRDRRRIAQAVPFEIESETPFELDDVFVDWELVADRSAESDVVATVVPRAEVARQLEALRELGVETRLLEVEGMVLGNLAGFIEMPGTRLLIDLGHRKTTLCLLVDGAPRAARTLPLGGRILTEAIARERGVAWEEAERLKHRDGVLGADLAPTSPAAARALERLVRELVRSIGGFESALGIPPEKAIDEITLLGGGARLQRVDEYLAAQLGMKTARLSVPPGDATGAFLAAGDPLRFAPALALALRGTLRARSRMNFLQAEFAPRLDLGRIFRQMRATAVLAALALALALASGVSRIGVESGRAEALEAQLAQIWTEAQPGKPVPSDVARALDQTLRDAQQRADFLGIYGGNLSALDVLTEISKLVPKDLAVIFEELSIDGQVVRLRGHTPSYAAVDQMKTALAAFPHFGEIRVSEIQADANRGGNTFSVTIGLTQSAADAPPPPPSRPRARRSPALSDWLDRIRSVIGSLSAQERMLLGAVGVTLVVAILYFGALRPALGGLRDAGNRVAAAERDIQVAQRLAQELTGIQGRLDAVERRIREGPKGNIFTTLEDLAKKSAVKVESMEPQAAPATDRYKETKVQLVLKQVTLAQAVSFLHGVESAPQLLSVKSLRFRTRSEQKEDLLDVTFTVSSFEPI